ncbi:MAG: MarR family winged helix-turn-helix transcriptional regulator [Anaerolineae bacterium]
MSASGPRNGSENGGARDAEQLRRLLHYGHIFSSAVQEILETKYLNEVSPYSLTVPQFHLLKLISLRGRHQVGEVAEFLGVSSPAVSKNIDKLEGLGLVTRRTARGDRRVTLLSASDEGVRLVNDYEKLKATRLEPVLRSFDSDELDQLSSLLERFSVRLFQSEDSGSGFCLRCAAYGDAGCSLVRVNGNCPYQRSRAQGPPAS